MGGWGGEEGGAGHTPAPRSYHRRGVTWYGFGHFSISWLSRIVDFYKGSPVVLVFLTRRFDPIWSRMLVFPRVSKVSGLILDHVRSFWVSLGLVVPQKANGGGVFAKFPGSQDRDMSPPW